MMENFVSETNTKDGSERRIMHFESTDDIHRITISVPVNCAA